jgi:hypothetical protein
MRSVLALLVLSLAASLSASADPAPRSHPAPDAQRMVTDDCALARKAGKTCELSLAPEDVGGSTAGPGDVSVRVLRLEPEPSLIHIRRHFVVEIVKSAEDL